jgi:hypothetical protein
MATDNVAKDSPAYRTVHFQKGRLLRERGDLEGARRVFDDMLSNSSDWPISDVNLLKNERLLVVTNLEEFTNFLWRKPIGFSNGAVTNGESEYCEAQSFSVKCEKDIFAETGSKQLLPQLGLDEALILNERIPLSMLVQIAKSKSLLDNLRKRVAPAVWARAVLLDRPEEAAAVSEIVVSTRPEMKPFLTQYAEAKTAEERRFYAAFAIAHFPGLRPGVNGPSPRVTRFTDADNYRDNWWCSNGLPEEFSWWPEANPMSRTAPQVPFLSIEERARATNEFGQIAALGDGGDWLSDTLIRWAETHIKDLRAPEALHFAWRATRYSCAGKENNSHEIFRWMHKHYPNSVWTRKTTVWW